MLRNITLSADETLVERAREVARKQGSTLNDVIRRYLETLVGERSGEVAAEELLRLMNEEGGHSGGRKIRRDEAYEDRR